MLPVVDRPLIDLQLKTFRSAGITSCSFVLGHGRATLAERIQLQAAGLDIQLIDNREFASRNMDWSAFLALNSAPGDTIYYEGDMLVDPTIIRDLAQTSAEVCLVVDAEGRSDAIDTRVIVEGTLVKSLLLVEQGIAEVPESANCAGELVCVVKLSDQARHFVLERLQRVEFYGKMKLYDIFNDLVAAFPAEFIEANGRAWIEIDNERDLFRAQDVGATLLRSL